MDYYKLVQTLLIYALPVLFAITIHEAAHGYVARALGDNTAHMMGRVTLNPVKHIDPFGTVLLPLLLYFTTPFLIGYAKPVPVNFSQLRHPKRDMVWVALAGPASNLVQALAWALAFTVLTASGVEERFFLLMCMAGVLVNFVLAAFNLFPFPPLDGGRILVGLLPHGPAAALSRLEPWGFFVVLGLFFLGVVGPYWVWPLVQMGYFTLDLLQISTPFPRVR